jgi:predicted RNA binding protein YcfA (HicA-like mRNA interferase family)
MAKLRKLVKAIEAAGWRPAVETDVLVVYRHPQRLGLLTLPTAKADLPPAVAQGLRLAAGLGAEEDGA